MYCAEWVKNSFVIFSQLISGRVFSHEYSSFNKIMDHQYLPPLSLLLSLLLLLLLLSLLLLRFLLLSWSISTFRSTSFLLLSSLLPRPYNSPLNFLLIGLRCMKLQNPDLYDVYGYGCKLSSDWSIPSTLPRLVLSTASLSEVGDRCELSVDRSPWI